ncbi:collagen-binding protein [Schaalia meyeri]|uniref:LPXTG cell wall anchor domain-containing protein n=1 Tax=Schaalia meyeri TaxID=52773 RepID=A0AAP9Y657_9ACTO|nr:CshA/CshB family fibrillar adhesin-related protein [Schaalia meyeri]AKU65795.1 collagen-binding protein [Schaalia meyeri]QQC43472.1 LPXTG cell wall anchor domain-containing protein [Schaalia meyeri]SDR93430.1 LPXTG-motif cell wall anchor domain-containing protein [Schaalia meyeri]
MTQHARLQSRSRRLARFAVAFAVCAAIGTAPILPHVVEQTQAAAERVPSGSLPATFATGGSGRFKESIQWLQWADYDKYFANQTQPYAPILDKGEVKAFTNSRDMGDAGVLVTTCTLSNLQHLGHGTGSTDEQSNGPLVATIPGTWAGDALDNLYNVGGPGSWSDGSAEWHEGLTYPKDYVNKNKMVVGLANGYANIGSNSYENPNAPWQPGNRPTGVNARVSVDLNCSAELRGDDGTTLAVPLSGLVFADAEASSNRKPGDDYDFQNEWVQASTSQQNVKWRVLDTLRSANCNGVTSEAKFVDSSTVRLMPTGKECVYQNGGKYSRPNGLGGPDAVMFMEGATKATITIQGGGYSAVALGLVIATDFGDAPESYGKASALFQPTWSGGQVTHTVDAFSVGKATMHSAQTILGTEIDAEGYQQHSDDALGDDQNGTADEDGLSVQTIAEGITTQAGATHQQTVACKGPGKVAGWIDWNHNGSFDLGEKSDEVPCLGSSVKLSWTVPDDVVRSVTGEAGSVGDTFMRLRITNDSNGDNQKATGNTTTGEVEDYKISVRIPTLQIVKNVDGLYASTEVPALAASEWTLTGKNSSVNAPFKTITGAGDTNIQRVLKGTYALSEESVNAQAGGYAAGEWTCGQTAGTVNAQGTSYSSTLSGSRVTIKNADRVTCTIVNTTKPGTLTWDKVESDGTTLLAGTTWTLTGPDVPTGTTVTDCSSGICPTGAYKDQDPAPGKFKLTGLKWGTYSIKESAVPDGYAVLTDTFTFPQLNGSALEARLAAIDGKVTDNGAIINTRLTGSVTWKKVDASDGTSPLAGSEWTISGGALPGAVTIADCQADSAAQCPKAPDGTYYDTDPAAGSFTVKGLPWSEKTYTLKEKKAPAGYRLDPTPHEFTIDAKALDFAFEPITNEKQNVPSLPLTGGFGADAYIIGGIVAGLGAAGVGAAIKRRKNRKA